MAAVSDFFQLVEGLEAIPRIKIETAYTTVRFDPDEIVYREGEPADAVFVVASGVVEAITQSADRTLSRSVAFMRQGAVFGEIGVLTGQPRVATIRACQLTKLFRFEKEKFLHLLRHIPEFGDYFCRILALRLHVTSVEAHQAVYELDLSGNLQRFDLLTIFQAITAMHHTGELKLRNSANEQTGSFFFRAGNVVEARFLHLVGVEAVWQGFIESFIEGTFSFGVRAEPSVPGDGEHAVQMDSTLLLVEGVSRRDAYQAMSAQLRAMTARLSRKTDALEWTEPATAAPAGRIWELIARGPQTLASLWRRLNSSALAFLEIVQALIDSGQAELLSDQPEGGKE